MVQTFSQGEIFWPKIKTFFSDIDPSGQKLWFGYVRAIQADGLSGLLSAYSYKQSVAVCQLLHDLQDKVKVFLQDNLSNKPQIIWTNVSKLVR